MCVYHVPVCIYVQEGAENLLVEVTWPKAQTTDNFLNLYFGKASCSGQVFFLVFSHYMHVCVLFVYVNVFYICYEIVWIVYMCILYVCTRECWKVLSPAHFLNLTKRPKRIIVTLQRASWSGKELFITSFILCVHACMHCGLCMCCILCIFVCLSLHMYMWIFVFTYQLHNYETSKSFIKIKNPK